MTEALFEVAGNVKPLEYLEFFEACVPPKATGSAKQVLRYGNRNIISKTKASLDAENTWHQVLAPHQPPAPIPGPISLTIELTWPWRKSEKKGVVALGRTWHTSRPDLDNLSKTITDCLVRQCFMPDDATVAILTMRKFWGDKPGVRIVIETIREGAI